MRSRLAGLGSHVNENIIIGHHHWCAQSLWPGSEVCYIDNIYVRTLTTRRDFPVVLVDRWRWTVPSLPGKSGKSSGVQPQAIPDAAEQAMLNLKVQNLRATVNAATATNTELTAQLQDNTRKSKKRVPSSK